MEKRYLSVESGSIYENFNAKSATRKLLNGIDINPSLGTSSRSSRNDILGKTISAFLILILIDSNQLCCILAKYLLTEDFQALGQGSSH